jgi:hypothetical protein
VSLRKKPKLLEDIFDELIRCDGRGDPDGKIPSFILVKNFLKHH